MSITRRRLTRETRAIFGKIHSHRPTAYDGPAIAVTPTIRTPGRVKFQIGSDPRPTHPTPAA